MKHRIAVLRLVAAVAMIFCASAACAATSTALSDAQRQFAAAFVSAANAKDAAAMRKLVLPQSLACYNQETEPYLDDWVATRLAPAIPSDYSVNFSPYTGGPIASKFIIMPAPPTEMMDIRFRGRQETSVFNNVREDGGRYYLVAPCLTAEGAKHFKDKQAKLAASAQKARDVFAKLNDPLRSQLATLLNQGRKNDAFRLCKQQLKLDSRTTMDVLDLVAGRGSDAESGRTAR